MRLDTEPVARQLSRLALAGRTGVLRLAGDNGGAIHLYLGNVTGAESLRTPDVARRLARWPAGPGSGGAPSALELDWVIREAIADAVLDMLTQAPRAARFTTGGVPGPDGAGVGAMTVRDLLAEVNRRRAITRQLPASFTADSVVARNPRFSAPGVHVSASQWALLVRMNELATPRGLAMDLGTSVFTTTLEVFRLITAGLVTVLGGPPPGKRAISFIRATAS